MAKELAPTPQQIATQQQAYAVASVRPELEGMIAKMEATTKANIFGLIRQNQLTPDQAVAAWMELYSYQRLNTRIAETAQGAQ